jgi:hypothetical protein
VGAQSIPSVSLQLALVETTGAQTPYVPASPKVQVPLQHSCPAVHTSPSWEQNEDTLHTPLAHSPEQHALVPPSSDGQGLLRVVHWLGSGTQVPLAQLPLQHVAVPLHAALSATQGGRLQTPPTHDCEQQSVPETHAPPSGRQVVFVPVVVVVLVVVFVVVLVVVVVPVDEDVLVVVVVAPPTPPVPPVPLVLPLPHPAATAPLTGSARPRMMSMRACSLMGSPQIDLYGVTASPATESLHT